uniref:Tetraspanin n=1 Tax=Macrostomum lignano TaxID=282301 RepID=A0A1I8I2B1_9PLAT
MAKGCTQCLRVVLIVINGLFLLIGLAILAGSLFLYFDTTMRNIKASTGLQIEMDIALFVAMAIGAITALAAGFGCCGAFHESTCLLGAFCTFVILVCIVEIGGGIFLYLKRTDPTVYSTINNSLKNGIRNKNETTLPEYIRFTQQWLRCCGANGTDDYSKDMAKAVCTAPDGEQFTELLCMIFAVSLCCTVRREQDGYIGVTTD